jgi:serine/threonine protein kinase
MIDPGFHARILALRQLSLPGQFNLPRFAQALTRYQTGLERTGAPTRVIDDALDLLSDPGRGADADHTAAQAVLAHLSGHGLFPEEGRNLRDFFDSLEGLRRTSHSRTRRAVTGEPVARLFASRDEILEFLTGDGERDLVPGYQILYPLARMSLDRPAEVLLAVDRMDNRRIALKIYKRYIPLEDVPSGGIFNEMRFQSGTAPDVFVHVVDAGRTRLGDPYLAFEWMQGGTLREFTRDIEEDPSRATWEEKLPYVRQMVENLATAHASGILHRDVKPDNFLLTADRSRLKLADFGIALREEEFGLYTSRLGTRSYLPPEYLQESEDGSEPPNGFARDVYSLGLTLCEFLTGLPISLVRDADRSTPPSRLRPERGIPSGMDALILRAVDPDPRRRFTNAVRMKEALDDVWAV